MIKPEAQSVLILGGGGFIGSHLVKQYLAEGYQVTIIDNSITNPQRFYNNLTGTLSRIYWIDKSLIEVNDLDFIISNTDLIIDCMGWSLHRMALKDPDIDLECNVKSHLPLIKCLDKYPDKTVFYLGSSGQYGNPQGNKITEETPLIPEDIQGIHKLTAESHYRVYSRLYQFNTVSLRIPNCFGENQLIQGEDIGLIGGFIRDLILGKNVDIYGHNRNRSFVYVDDLSEWIYLLSKNKFKGFHVFNASGYYLEIKELVIILHEIIGKGSYSIKELPHEAKVIDAGNSYLSSDKLKSFLGELPITDLKVALSSTVQYFTKMLLK